MLTAGRSVSVTMIQLGASRRVFLKVDAEANFSDIHEADIDRVKRLCVVKSRYARFRPWRFRPSDRILVSSNHAIRARHPAHWRGAHEAMSG